MKLFKFLLFITMLLFAVPNFSQTWTNVCDGTSGTCAVTNPATWSYNRGFVNKLAWDNNRQGFIFPGASDTVNIYSEGFWLYKSAHGATPASFNRIAWNGTNAADYPSICIRFGGYYATASPANGHPNGEIAFDPTNNKVYWISGLCGNNFNPIVNILNSTGTMDAPISAYEFPSCTPSSPTGQCGNGRNFQSSDYWPAVGKIITCCSDSNSNAMTTLFDKTNPSSPFTNITSLITASDGSACNFGVTCPFGAWTAFSSALDTADGNMYYYGGCAGTSPGNVSPNVCNGANQNDLWQLSKSGSAYKWTKMAATTKPSSTNASWPFFVYDSNRNRFVVVDDTNSVWFGTISGTNVIWANLITSGGFTFTSTVRDGNSNIAGYDPVNDVMVFFYNNGGGQSVSPAISQLSFGGSVGFTVQLTAQEALSPAVNGPNNIGQPTKASTAVSRTNDPVTQGVPLPDAWAVSGTAPQLGFTGTGAPSSGQFTCTQQWPSGNCKWVLVSTLVPSLTAGSTTAMTMNTGGTGNFGGSNLITDNTTFFTISTGTATFTVNKANFRILNSAVIGVTNIVSPSSDGIVAVGPAVGNTSCSFPPSDCSTEYKSSNDASSTVVLVENGPVKGVLRADGALKNGSQTYFKYTMWLTFYKNQNAVRYTLALRNADDSTSVASFANAFKMMKSLELRTLIALGSSRNAVFSTDTTNQSYTFGGTESAFKFQGFSNRFATADGPTLVNLSSSGGVYSIEGEQVIVNGSNIYSGTKNQYDDAFWADITDASGVGVQLSVFEGDGYWPKSLEYRNGGTDVRIGVFPDQSLVLTTTAIPYTLPYPQHQYTEGMLNFHTTALASANNEALKYQSPLIIRAPVAQYNTAQVWPWVYLSDPSEQDNYLATVGAAAVPTISAGAYTQQTDYAAENYWGYGWGGTGGAINTDERWDAMAQFIRRGWTGHYLWAKAGFKYMMEGAFPSADGFRWSDHLVTHPGDINTAGYPFNVVFNYSANKAGVNYDGGTGRWCDQYHCHPEGAVDWFYVTGDYAVQDWFKDAVSDHYSAHLCKNLQPGATTPSGTCSNFVYINVARGLGAVLGSATRLHNYYNAPGPTNNSSYAGEFDTVMNGMYLTATPDASVSGTGTATYGTSRTRGVFNPQSVGSLITVIPPPTVTPNDATLYFSYFTTPYAPGCTSCYYNFGSANVRNMQPYQMSVWLQAWEEMLAERGGQSWTNYSTARDLELGWVQWSMKERTYNNGSGKWLETFIDPETGVQDPYSSYNGIRYTTALDYVSTTVPANSAANPGTFFEIQPWYGLGSQTVWYVWSVYVDITGDTSFEQTMKLELQKLMGHGGNSWYDMPGYMLGNAIHKFVNPPSNSMQTVPVTVTPLGGGSYTLSWTNPSSTQSLALKYSTKTVVDWLNFTDLSGTDAGGIGGQWGLSPSTNQPWFSATYTPTQPTLGSTSITVSGLPTGLSTSNFMLKALATGAPTPPPPPPPPPSSNTTGKAGLWSCTGQCVIQ